MNNVRGRIVAAAILVAAAGCGEAGDASTQTDSEFTPSATPAPTPTPDARYGTVKGLVDASILAGYECKRWKQDNAVKLAAQSGTCSNNSVFATFASEGDLQEQLDIYREFDEMWAELEMGESNARLVGPNWIINAPEAAELQASLGGTVENG